MIQSFDLYSKNPNLNTDFPILILDVNHDYCVPKRSHFHELHWHDEIQIIYVLKGHITVSTLQQNITVHEDQAIFINSKVLHIIKDSVHGHYRTYLIPLNCLLFKEEKLNKQITSFLNQSPTTLYLIKEKEILELIFKLPQYQDIYILCSLISLIMSLLIKKVPQTDSSVHYLQERNIEQCIIFIHQHYQEDLSLADIASFCHLSIGYLGKIFKSSLSVSPYEYLIQYLINQSLTLLAHPQNNITEVALQVGFNSVSHYIQAFKKYIHITPKQYQKELFKQ